MRVLSRKYLMLPCSKSRLLRNNKQYVTEPEAYIKLVVLFEGEWQVLEMPNFILEILEVHCTHIAPPGPPVCPLSYSRAKGHTPKEILTS